MENGGGEKSAIVMKPNRTDVENEIEGLLCFEDRNWNRNRFKIVKRLDMHCKYYAFKNELTSTGFGKNSGSNFLEIFDIEMPGTQFIYSL